MTNTPKITDAKRNELRKKAEELCAKTWSRWLMISATSLLDLLDAADRCAQYDAHDEATK